MSAKIVQDSSLTAIADAIRAKTGKSASIQFPTEFVSEIESISGDTPIPSDGKSRIFCNFTHENSLTPMLGLGVNGSVDVDWGDGSAHDTLTGTNSSTLVTVTHTYATTGEYTIILAPSSGTSYSFMGVNNYGSRVIFKSTTTVANAQRPYNSAIRKIYVGTGALIGNYAFNHCYALEKVVLPDGITNLGTNAFHNCSSLRSISFPEEITSIGSASFQNCNSLLEVNIPSGISAIPNSAFQNCYVLQDITIPDGVSTIGSYAFTSCYSLTTVTIPDSVTSIGASAFGSNNGILEYHCKSSEPPSISSANSLSVPDGCVIYVPQGSLEAYQAATNWSTYASYMQEETT